MREIFVPSMAMPAISPCWLKIKAAVLDMRHSRRFAWSFAFGFAPAGMTSISAQRGCDSYTAMEALNKSILDFPARPCAAGGAE